MKVWETKKKITCVFFYLFQMFVIMDIFYLFFCDNLSIITE